MRRHAIARAIAGARWNPRDGLIGSDQGLWLDPSDLSTMFQDSGDTTGTVPVTTVEQKVGLILDKSGRGNHAFAPTDAARPTLKQDANGRYYLLFNGSTSMRTNSIDFTATDKLTVFAGVRKLSDAGVGVLAETSIACFSNNGSFVVGSPDTAATYSFGGRGTIFILAVSPTNFAAPITNVLTGIGNISGDQAILRVNGTQAAISTTDQGTGNYGNYPLYIGARAGTSLFFNGNLYQLVICGRPTTVPIDQITRTEEFVNRKTKAY